ncbi:MAG: SRPBCC domain-containing protein [Acidimicrobiales bacterium]
MRVTREVLLDASVEEVWQLLTEDDELSEWFGGSVSIDVRPGGGGRFLDGGAIRHAVVDEVDEHRRLRFHWWPEGDDDSASDVAFELAQEGDSTRLTVVEQRPTAGGKACVLWDDRLFDLELRCLTRRWAPVPR